MVIHFFRNRNEERINFFELVDNYFGTMENCKIAANDEVVEMNFEYPEFNFSYQYLITKRTRVSSMYRLNSQFLRFKRANGVDFRILINEHRLDFKLVAKIYRRIVHFERKLGQFSTRYDNYLTS